MDANSRNAIDAEVVEARVLLFGVLRSELCEALAEVQQAASSPCTLNDRDGGADGDGNGGELRWTRRRALRS